MEDRQQEEDRSNPPSPPRSCPRVVPLSYSPVIAKPFSTKTSSFWPQTVKRPFSSALKECDSCFILTVRQHLGFYFAFIDGNSLNIFCTAVMSNVGPERKET